jgi:hypothetical protein
VKFIDRDHERLLARPVEPETRIRSSRYRRIAGIPLLLEEWTYDGIRAHSVVFLAEHVGMDDAALQTFLSQQARIEIGGSVTVVRRDNFVCVDFGFEAD